MPAVLTVRLSKEEQGILAKRSKRAGMKKATFVRKVIRDEEIVSGADLLAWASRHAWLLPGPKGPGFRHVSRR